MGLLTTGEQAHSHIRGRLRPRSIETIFNALNQGLLVGSIIFSNSRRARTANFILALQNSAALGARTSITSKLHPIRSSKHWEIICRKTREIFRSTLRSRLHHVPAKWRRYSFKKNHFGFKSKKRAKYF